MAVGFVSKNLGTLLSNTAQWVEFSNGVQGPVNGVIALDPTSGLALDLTQPSQVVGGVADTGADDNKPGVPIVGKVLTTAPTLTNGMLHKLLLGLRGALIVQVHGRDSTAGMDVSQPSDTFANTKDGATTNARTLAWDGTQWKRAGSWLWSKISTATTTAVRGSAGILHGVTINTPAAGTLTLYDNASTATGSVIAIIDTSVRNTYSYDARVANGIVAVTSGTADLTVLHL